MHRWLWSKLTRIYSLWNDVIDTIFYYRRGYHRYYNHYTHQQSNWTWYNTSHKMLKNTVSTIVKPLCLLFKRSLKDCLFPHSWKIGKVLIYRYLRKVIHQNCQTTDLCHYWVVLGKLWNALFINICLINFIETTSFICFRQDFF